MTLIDTHCHLNMPPLGDDPAAVLARAAARGVGRVIVPAYDHASWAPIVALPTLLDKAPNSPATPANSPSPDVLVGKQNGRFPSSNLPADPSAQVIRHSPAIRPAPVIHFALGIHPWVAAQVPPGEGLALAARLAEQAAKDAAAKDAATKDAADIDAAGHTAPTAAPRRLVAIGEIGLDTKIDLTAPGASLADQQRLLAVQLAAAVDLDLPVILHCRGAFEELLTAVQAHGGRLRGVLHAFSRSAEVARRFLDAGLHIGLGGAITRPNARKVRRAAATLPLERIVLETDAPSIGLDGVLPADTEPAHVADVAAALAALRGLPVAEVAAATTGNAEALFRLSE